MKTLEWNTTVAFGSSHQHCSVQRHQGNTHVAGVNGNAVFRSPENGMHPVKPIYSAATGAWLPFIARHIGVVKIRAPGTLHHIASYSSHVADLLRSTGFQSEG